jgi:DNA mismatch repair protein MutS2
MAYDSGVTERFGVGDAVQTPLGKGVVRELRNNGRLVVEVRGRAAVVRGSDISRVDPASRKRRGTGVPARVVDAAADPAAARTAARVPSDVDLHGLTVEEALARAEEMLNSALLANAVKMRFIHGRSGGRIRGALHKWLRGVSAVRSFRIDPANEGVTIVIL